MQPEILIQDSASCGFPMAVDAGSELPVALSCAQLLALTSNAEIRPPLLLDLRSLRRFRHGHIAGSHSLPAARLISGEPPEGELILISETPQEALLLVEALHNDGYQQRIRYLGEGLAGWRARGLPLQAAADRRQTGSGWSVLQGLAGTGLILAAAVLTSLPLFAFGLLLIWGAWSEPLLLSQPRRQRLI